jgi:2-dehydro-3-deoxygalactonokinase
VPGIASQGDSPDMMRGEETQVVGALALHPELAARSHFVLPGTHSKWIDVEDGRITSVRTFMTGELFSVLRTHSILGRPVRTGANDSVSSPHRAFAAGVRTARDGRHGLSPLLFAARAMVLANRIASEDAADFLSGVLIGDELRAGLTTEGHALVLVGDATLCGRYAEALEQFDVADPMIIGDASRAGLWAIGSMAGLVDRTDGRPA